MTDRIWSLALFAIGTVWVYGGWVLWQSEREDAMFDAMGPDRYVMILGGLMMFCALMIAAGRSAPMKEEARDGEGALTFFSAPVTFTILLAAYSLVMPRLGYTVSTFLFFIFAFFLAGRRNPAGIMAASLLSTAAFYALFPYLADMNLPVGIVGF
jgi:hypothetical protein